MAEEEIMSTCTKCSKVITDDIANIQYGCGHLLCLECDVIAENSPYQQHPTDERCFMCIDEAHYQHITWFPLSS